MTKASPCIIDCDPGIDDTLAILHAMGSPKVDVKAITLTYGNTNRDNVTKNLFTILHILGKEVSSERLATLPAGPNRDRLEHIRSKKPVVSVGASKPLVVSPAYGEDFHGPDGLGRLHLNDPSLAPSDWDDILKTLDPEGLGKELAKAEEPSEKLFTLSRRLAHDEILHQLEQSEPNTLTIIAIGPLNNVALAYEKDPVTFARCKRVICMGGCFDIPGLHYTSMHLHDPLCIGFFMDLENEEDLAKVGWKVEGRDVRIESDGTLTRGMLVVDRRVKSTVPAPGKQSLVQVVLKADPERYLVSMLYDIWGVTDYKGREI
ncbi:hypothetical protein BGZ80_009694 [Entomortierella chlamydospora]|uniref:Inosine/uridine-preferring nucleoside hydrolase domain-containing protein n=1 Tax=Entomortierella chlamydospora TaxID=101097 RepID=A0A9P6MWU7_9FUNG|nr:hypothetical protein BGZ80_009694 [Entomortierella chlamydospora]